MDHQIYEYPLLDIAEDTSDLERLHKILITLRELHNTREPTNLNLGWGEFNGWAFGCSDLVNLLSDEYPQQNRVDKFNEAIRKYTEAITAAKSGKSMVDFVRWATDKYSKLMFQRVPHHAEASQANRAKRGVATMASVENRLHANTAVVRRKLQRDDLCRADEDRRKEMLNMLGKLLEFVRRLQSGSKDAVIGYKSISLILTEIDFVDPRQESATRLFESLLQQPLTVTYCLETIQMVIVSRLELRGHPMAIEYAIKAVLGVVFELDYDGLNNITSICNTPKLRDIGLWQLGEKLQKDLSAAMDPYTRATPTPAVSERGTPVRGRALFRSPPQHYSSIPGLHNGPGGGGAGFANFTNTDQMSEPRRYPGLPAGRVPPPETPRPIGTAHNDHQNDEEADMKTFSPIPHGSLPRYAASEPVCPTDMMLETAAQLFPRRQPPAPQQINNILEDSPNRNLRLLASTAFPSVVNPDSPVPLLAGYGSKFTTQSKVLSKHSREGGESAGAGLLSGAMSAVVPPGSSGMTAEELARQQAEVDAQLGNEGGSFSARTNRVAQWKKSVLEAVAEGDEDNDEDIRMDDNDSTI